MTLQANWETFVFFFVFLRLLIWVKINHIKSHFLTGNRKMENLLSYFSYNAQIFAISNQMFVASHSQHEFHSVEPFLYTAQAVGKNISFL